MINMKLLLKHFTKMLVTGHLEEARVLAGLLATPYNIGEFSDNARSLALDNQKPFDLGPKGRKYVEEETF
jgi:hypothetical protein